MAAVDEPGLGVRAVLEPGRRALGLSIVGIIAVFGMVWMLRKSRSDQRILHWALALVAGGAVGNLVDRIYFGVVTDFVLWQYKTHDGRCSTSPTSCSSSASA